MLKTQALCAAASCLMLTAISHASTIFVPPPSPTDPIINPESQFHITADGQYTTAQEWSDVHPAWFNSTPAGGAVPVLPNAANANSLLFAAIAQGVVSEPPELYLMYDYLARTQQTFAPGEFIASVSFPLNVPQGNTTVSKTITVNFNAPSAINLTANVISSPTSIPVNVSIDLHDGSGPHLPAEFDIDAAVGFGTTPTSIVGAGSPFATTNHMLIELGVPLLIPANFGSAFPTDGLAGPKGSGYSPDPAFWGSNISNDQIDPPASSAFFDILPNGSTMVLPAPSPEPTSLGLLTLGTLALLTRRRRA